MRHLDREVVLLTLLGVSVGLGGTVGAAWVLGYGWWQLLAQGKGELGAACLMTPFLLALAAGGAWLASWTVAWSRGRVAFGPLRAEASREAYGPGERVDVRITFTPARPLTDLHVEAALCCVAEQGESDTLLRLPATLVKPPLDVPADREVVLELWAVLPRDALASGPRGAGADSIAWWLEADLRAAGWRSVSVWPRTKIEVVAGHAGPVHDGAPSWADLQGVATIEVDVQPGQVCPFCRDGLRGAAADALLTCGGCRAVYHRACALEAAACATIGCRNHRRPDGHDRQVWAAS